jgi:mannan endo-1,4-beta-mannosidase
VSGDRGKLVFAGIAVVLMIGGSVIQGGGSKRDSSDPSELGRPQPRETNPKKLRPAKDKILIGAFDPKVENGQSDFEKTLGRKVQVVSVYQSWGGDPEFKRDWAEAVTSRGQVPMITWEPWVPKPREVDQPDYRLKAIIAGKHDEYLKQWFSDVGDWDGPIFVRFAHEMNGHWYPWGMHVNTAEDYVDAWRHVVDLSREVGADNITWVWAPNETSDHDLSDFYPGDDYVDWTGMSSFNWGGKPMKGNETSWRDFSELYEPTLRQLEKFDKPIMIAETGTIENDVADNHSEQTKAEWIEETFAEMKRHRSQIGLVVWFNDIFRDIYDWRISTSPESADALRKALADPAFNGRFDQDR